MRLTNRLLCASPPPCRFTFNTRAEASRAFVRRQATGACDQPDISTTN